MVLVFPLGAVMELIAKKQSRHDLIVARIGDLNDRICFSQRRKQNNDGAGKKASGTHGSGIV